MAQDTLLQRDTRLIRQVFFFLQAEIGLHQPFVRQIVLRHKIDHFLSFFIFPLLYVFGGEHEDGSNPQALVAAFQDLMIPRQGQLLVGPFFCRCESGHDKCSVQCQSEGMDHGGAAGIFPDFLFHETAAFFQPFAISFLLQNLCNFPAETGDLLFGWFFLKTEQGIGICFQKPCKGREQCDIRVSDA